eukprot:775192-Pyramimonas_sp.AAC.1
MRLGDPGDARRKPLGGPCRTFWKEGLEIHLCGYQTFAGLPCGFHIALQLGRTGSDRVARPSSPTTASRS